MKIIHKLLLVLAAACTALPAVQAGAVTADAREDQGFYPMACSAYEVDNVNDRGGFDKVGCYNTYSSALDAMKKLGDDGVVRHAASYSETKIIAMNNGMFFAYPFRSGTSMMYYWQDRDFSSAYAVTYSGQHYQGKYYDTAVYNGNGTGSVHMNLNGFDGYVQLKDCDLVPLKFFEKKLSIILGGRETFYSTPEEPYSIIPLMNTYECRINGNYKDMMFSSYYGWPDSTGFSMRLNGNTALPAAEWMNPGVTYYSYNGYDFYTDQGFHNYAGQYYNYYQFLPMRSKTSISAKAFDLFLDDRNVASDSKLRGAGQAFINAQNDYGVNALIVYAMACLESGYGTSYYARSRNNFFGWGAVDSNPDEAAYYSTVEEGIRTQMSENLAGYLDMNDWRFYGSMIGNKGAGFNLKYASAVYWGIEIAAIAYRIDKCSKGYDGTLTDFDQVAIGIVTNPKAAASLTKDGKTAYDITSCNGKYVPLYPVAVLEQQDDSLKTQCTNYVVDGKIYFISSSADVRKFDWQNSVGWFDQDDVTIVNRKTGQSEPEPEPEPDPEPEIGDPVRTLDSISVKETALSLSGRSYVEGLKISDGNDCSVTVRAADSSYETYASSTAVIRSENESEVYWSASFELSEFAEGIYFFETEFTYAKTPEYGSSWYLKSDEAPEELTCGGRRYTFANDSQGFIRLEIQKIVCPEGSHYEESAGGCAVDPVQPQEPEPEIPSQLPVDDLSMLRSVDTVRFDEESGMLYLRGLAFFTGIDAPQGCIGHSLVLVNTETMEETVLDASTDAYDYMLAGKEPDYTDVGYTAALNLYEVAAGNYYFRIRTGNGERTGEGALFCNQENISRTVVNANGETVRFFANPLSNYRLELSVEKQSLDLDTIDKPSRMTSLFGYQSVSLDEGSLVMDGIGIMYNASMTENDDVRYTVWLEDEEGNTYSCEADSRASGIDFSSIIRTVAPLTYVSFDLDMDLQELNAGDYRVYLEITTEDAHDLFEIYSIAADAKTADGSDGRTYTLKTTDVRSRYILSIR